ncbi:hypothetical protein MKK69_29295 [Methylobacterium sp. J-026]|uniref:hypothetical protein n=1 Tax=Methylobacterium sp. J-026 TaxID=2836624 RepID=UPI001FB92DAE|nr:hypothetical protein [Methylobacterium sp. J-026]MCJ2138097.1 hypothetical protein [Methylobacterium sp. J-026]
MISSSSCSKFQVGIFLGKRAIESVSSIVEKLRHSCGQSYDMTVSMAWFLALSDRWNTLPVVILLHSNRIPFGALLLHGTKFGRFPIGTFRGGYLCGRGCVIGNSNNYMSIIEYGTAALIKNRFSHTIIVSLLIPPATIDETAGRQANATPSKNWQFREMRSSLPLAGGMSGLTSRFSQKMRKNFRYYKRRAEEDFGCVFHASLTSIQATAAVERLQAVAARFEKLEKALRRQSAIEKQPGSFSMGLTDKTGAWVSYISGWRQGKTCIVEWQLNHENLNNSSMSMAMRHFFLQHEIDNGMEGVVFLAGTTPIWSRVCEPQICGDYLATPEGIPGKIIRGAYSLLHPRGKVSQLSRLHKKSAA